MEKPNQERENEGDQGRGEGLREEEIEAANRPGTEKQGDTGSSGGRKEPSASMPAKTAKKNKNHRVRDHWCRGPRSEGNWRKGGGCLEQARKRNQHLLQTIYPKTTIQETEKEQGKGLDTG